MIEEKCLSQNISTFFFQNLREWLLFSKLKVTKVFKISTNKQGNLNSLITQIEKVMLHSELISHVWNEFMNEIREWIRVETGMCTQISRARVDRSCPHVVLFRQVRGAAHIARIRCDSGSRSDPLECGERGSSSQPNLRAESRAERRAEGARPGARCSRVQIGKFKIKNKKSKRERRETTTGWRRRWSASRQNRSDPLPPKLKAPFKKKKCIPLYLYVMSKV
jgi:hypothetical protein